MRMRLMMLVAAAVLAVPAAGATQADDEYFPFARPPRPIPPKLPSEEALALGRRIVVVADDGTIAGRTAQLVAIGRAREPRRPPVPTYPNGPIRAVPPVDLHDYPDWGFVVQQRVIDHAALFYARRYSLDELKTMAAFFESPIGKRLAEERIPQSAELERELATKLLEDDLWNVVCLRPVPQDLEHAPHHEFHRLHPPMDYPLPPPPAYCGRD